jgi:plastocyanin
MRFNGMALLASAIVFGACGGGEKRATDTTATTTSTTTTDNTAGTPAGGTAATAGTSGAAGAAAPITGKTVEVKMLGDEKGYRFDPANVTIKRGDGVKWTLISGGPHNVAFDNVPANAKAQLSANMPNQMGELSSPMFMNPNEAYTISFANVPAGTYNYHCTPHLAMNMKGTVTVQ